MENPPKELKKLFETAKKLNVPEDQIKRFVECGYIPFPWQLKFHAAARMADKEGGPVDIGLGGARGPGKSHGVLSQVALDDCQRVPGLKGLFLRQTGIAAKESFDDLVDKTILGRIPFERVGLLLRFPNGSKIVLGGFKSVKDIDKYIGIEYDFMIVEELNQITEDKYLKLRGSLRTSKPNWRPRIYTSFNPGGIGHAFVKKRYVIPFREKKQKETLFLGATYKDNPFLNKEYIDYLESLRGDLGRAWREGEWDLFEGQVFSEFRYDLHSIKRVMPKASLSHFLWTDWGYSEKSAFASYASALIQMKSEDGDVFNRVVTYQEWYGNQKTPREWARLIYNKNRKYTRWIIDDEMTNPRADRSKPLASQFTDEWRKLHGRSWIHSIKPGTKKTLQKIATVHNWLSIAPDGIPYWVITENCINLLRTLPMLVYDENKTEHIDKTQTDSGITIDHAFDACSYGLGHIKFITIPIGLFGSRQQETSFKVAPEPMGTTENPMNLDVFRGRAKIQRDWKTI